MKATKVLMSIGTAVAAGKLARIASSLSMDDVLGPMGLARRRSHALENLLFLGAGAIAGAGVALLFAPAAGNQTRARIGREFSRLGDAATEAVRHTTESARQLVHSEGPKNSERAR